MRLCFIGELLAAVFATLSLFNEDVFPYLRGNVSDLPKTPFSADWTTLHFLSLPSEAVRSSFSKEALIDCVNISVYDLAMAQVQVQVRLPPKTIEEIDKWIGEKKFKSRSDAIRAILNLYQEREKTREFLKMLSDLDEEIKKHPERLIPLEEV